MGLEDLFLEEQRLLARLRELRCQIMDRLRALRTEGRHLTPRQEEVMRCVLDGKTNKEIAGALNLSERAVKFHVSCLLHKFAVDSRRKL